MGPAPPFLASPRLCQPRPLTPRPHSPVVTCKPSYYIHNLRNLPQFPCSQATSEQSPTETLVSRFAKWYTPAVVAVCTCLALVPWLSGADNMRVRYACRQCGLVLPGGSSEKCLL